MTRVLFGVCCACQENAPVVFTDDPRVEVDERSSCGAALVMAPHMIGGSLGLRCSGEGAPPQATFVKDLDEEALYEHKMFLEDPTDDSVGYAGEGDWPPKLDLEAAEYTAIMIEGGEESEGWEDLPEEPDPDDWEAQVMRFGGRLGSPNRCRRVAA